MVQETEDSKNLYVQPIDINLEGGVCWMVRGQGGWGIKGKNWENCNSIINKNT